MYYMTVSTAVTTGTRGNVSPRAIRGPTFGDIAGFGGGCDRLRPLATT
jgi:hypothetical protein